MKNTLILFVLIFITIIGITMCLILLYASPTEKAQVLEASITYLGTSILISSILFHVSFEEEKDNLIRLIFILIGILLIAYGIILGLIVTYASPDNINPVNTTAILLFILSSFITITAYIFMIKHNPKERINEK